MRDARIAFLIAFALSGCTTHDSAEGGGGVAAAPASGGAGGAPASDGSNAGDSGGMHALPSGGTSGTGAGGSGGAGGGTGQGAQPIDDASIADAAADAEATDAAADASPLDPFNGMCSSARWSTVSDACWSCWCAACADTLNAATRRSLEIFECMFEEQLLVNDFLELGCEVNAGTQVCTGDDMDDWDLLVSFDLCLMGAATAPAFRACEVECELEYPGDVCTRYP